MGPEQRVVAFIADWYEQWQQTAPLFDRTAETQAEVTDAFDIWGERLAAVRQRHGTDTLDPGGRSFGSQPEHRPGAEEIQQTEQSEPGRARIVTRSGAGMLYPGSFQIYQLSQINQDWRIDRIIHTSSDPGDLFVPAAERGDLLAAISAEGPWQPLPPGEPADFALHFVDGREVEVDGETDQIRVREVGRLRVDSGGLVVGDLGYTARELRPLHRAIAAGEYPVEVAIVADHVAAARLRLGRPAVTWYAAMSAHRHGHVIGVDAGNVAFIDLGALTEVTVGEKEEVFAEYASLPTAPAVMVADLAGHPSAVAIVESGYGDGGYPVVWGVADDGTPAEVVVDFGVLVAETVSEVECAWRIGRLAEPDLAANGIDVEITEARSGGLFHRRREYTVLVSGAEPTSAAVLGPDGQILIEFDEPVRTSDGRAAYRWFDAPRALEGARLRLSTRRTRRGS